MERDPSLAFDQESFFQKWSHVPNLNSYWNLAKHDLDFTVVGAPCSGKSQFVADLLSSSQKCYLIVGL